MLFVKYLSLLNSKMIQISFKNLSFIIFLNFFFDQFVSFILIEF